MLLPYVYIHFFLLLRRHFGKIFSFLRGTKEKQREHLRGYFCWMLVVCASNYFTMALLFICRFRCLCASLSMSFAIHCHAVTVTAGAKAEAAADNDDDDDDDCGLLNCPRREHGQGKSTPCHSTICRNILLYYLSFNYYFCDAVIILKTNEVLYILLCASAFFYLSCFSFSFCNMNNKVSLIWERGEGSVCVCTVYKLMKSICVHCIPCKVHSLLQQPTHFDF